MNKKTYVVEFEKRWMYYTAIGSMVIGAANLFSLAVVLITLPPFMMIQAFVLK